MILLIFFLSAYRNLIRMFNSVQLLSCVQLFVTPWTAARQASLSITNSRSPPKPMSIESVMPSNHLILCRSLLFPPSILLRIRAFSNESALHIRQPKYWSFDFSISTSNEYSGLISFRIDWFDLLTVQGNIKSLLQDHSLRKQIWTITEHQFSRSVVSDSLQPHEPQHTRPPCPSPTPGVHPNPYPSSWWCHPTISSPVVPFFSCPQSFPASGSFQMSQLFTSGGQNIGVSASTSVLPVNTQTDLL